MDQDAPSQTSATVIEPSLASAAPPIEHEEDYGATSKVKRRALGRGLGALLTSTSSLTKVKVPEPHDFSAPGTGIEPQVQPKQNREQAIGEKSSMVSASYRPGFYYLPLDHIQPNPNQPRKTFSESELNELTSSIKTTGLIQPIVVRPAAFSNSGQQHFEIVAGERRYRAAKLSGLNTIPAIVRALSDRECLELSIVENVQRADLNPMEEAYAYHKLATDFGESHGDIAKSLGKDRASIANSIRLIRLPEHVQNMIRAGQITAGHGRALLMLEDKDSQVELAKRVVEEHLSVRFVESLAKKLQNTSPTEKSSSGDSEKTRTSPTVAELEERLRRALGTKIRLSVSPKGRGELRISFFSQDELESLIEKIGA